MLAGLEIADQVFQATKAIIAEASALDALATATGSSVEQLSKLNNQARLAGADLGTLENALLTLSAGMADANVKGSKTQQALQLLGISSKDPAKALEEVVLALNKYADGAEKVALINALFGRSNAAFVATLKDMAESQNVQATVTAKQAREAAELEKALRELSHQSTTFANIVLSDVVPAMLRLVTEFNEGIKLAGGFGAALRSLGTINPFNTAAENIASLTQRLEKLKAGTGVESFFSRIYGTKEEVQRQLEVAKAFEQFRQRQQAMEGAGRLGDLSDQVSRANRLPSAPKLPGGGDRTRALKEQTTEAQRYLETLEKQNERAIELTHTEQFLRDIQMDRIKGLTPAITDQILKQTQLLDSTEALKKAEEERKKAAEEAAKAEQRIAEATSHAVKSAMQEVESIKSGNEQLQEQIAFLKGGEEAVNRLTDAKLADTIATKEAELAVLKWGEANEMWIQATEDQIRLLRERQQLIGDKRAAQAAAEEAKKAKQFADDLGNALAQGAENAIIHFNKLRDVLKSLEQDLIRIIARKLVTEPLGNYLSGLIGAGLSAGGGSALAFSGGGFGEHFASGGVSRGGWAMVGERGPEMVNLPRGAEVVPNDVLRARRGSVSISNTFVLAGPADRRTQDQIGVRAAASIQRAMRKVG